MFLLIGLGLGPGDPELLTLRAVRLLREADQVFVPGMRAHRLVSPYCTAEVLTFPMTNDGETIARCMEENAERVRGPATSGTAVLGIIGDPNFFSTFWRLCRVIRDRYPEITCATEPGVSAITAFASIAGVSFSDGFVVSDGGLPGSRILLKVRRPKETAERLAREGYRDFVLVERMYMEDMRVYRGNSLPETSDYFSILYAGRKE